MIIGFQKRKKWIGVRVGVFELYPNFIWMFGISLTLQVPLPRTVAMITFVQVTHHGKLHHYVDARDVSTSNWLRFINCSRHRREENVMTCACKGRLYYISSRDIYPGRELLVYYGDDYAGYELDIDVVNYEKAGS